MTMQDVDHTHPYTNRSFGEMMYERGAIAADGGREADEDDSMGDVDHEPPHGDGANRVFERGTEGRDGAV